MVTKKSLLLICSLILSSVIVAQSDFSYTLRTIKSSDDLDSVRFTYGENLKLLSCDVLSYSSDGDVHTIDTLLYDERDNVIRVNTYQETANGWIFPTYLEYTYDENNNRITRTNYNDWGSGFSIQGVYTYTYENNLCVYHEMTLGGSLYERCVYTNDANGHCIEKVAETVDFMSGGWENSYKVVSEYDDNGNCIQEGYFYWDNGSWVRDNYAAYTFEDNDCMVYTYYQGNDITERKTFSYDKDIMLSDIMMPNHPEPFFSSNEACVHQPLKYAWEVANDNGTLIYACDFDFIYEENAGAGMSESYTQQARVFPNPAENQVVVNQSGLKTIDIIDAQGKVVYHANASSSFETISLEQLKSGIYMLKTFDGHSVQTNKLIVK